MFILLGRKVVKLFLTISLRLQSTCAYTFHQECIAGNRKFTLEESQDKLLLFYITMLSVQILRLRGFGIEFCDVFALEDEDRREIVDIEHHVEMAGHPPIYTPLHRVPFVLHEMISALVQEMLE